MSTVHRDFAADTTATMDSRDIFEQAKEQKCGSCANVGHFERALSGLVGGTLIAAGLFRRSPLGAAGALVGAGLVHRAASGRCMVYQSLGVNTAHGGGFRRHCAAVGVPARRGRKHETTIVINRSANQLFDYWRRLHHLPKLFDHLVSVVQLDDVRSHWVAQGPLGRQIEWDAELYNQRPDEMLAWRSFPGSDLDTAGSIHFAPTTDGSRTIVTLNMKYNPPGGDIGSTVADWLGQSVEDELDEGLRRFRELAEAGEVATTFGQPRGNCRTF